GSSTRLASSRCWSRSSRRWGSRSRPPTSSAPPGRRRASWSPTSSDGWRRREPADEGGRRAHDRAGGRRVAPGAGPPRRPDRVLPRDPRRPGDGAERAPSTHAVRLSAVLIPSSTMRSLFARIASVRTLDRPAIVGEHGTLVWGELLDRARGLALRL